MQYNIVLVPKCWPINYNVIANLLSVVAEAGGRGGLPPTWKSLGGQLCIFTHGDGDAPYSRHDYTLITCLCPLVIILHLDHLYRLYICASAPPLPRCSKIVPRPMPALWQYRKNNTHSVLHLLHQYKEFKVHHYWCWSFFVTSRYRMSKLDMLNTFLSPGGQHLCSYWRCEALNAFLKRYARLHVNNMKHRTMTERNWMLAVTLPLNNDLVSYSCNWNL